MDRVAKTLKERLDWMNGILLKIFCSRVLESSNPSYSEPDH